MREARRSILLLGDLRRLGNSNAGGIVRVWVAGAIPRGRLSPIELRVRWLSFTVQLQTPSSSDPRVSSA